MTCTRFAMAAALIALGVPIQSGCDDGSTTGRRVTLQTRLVTHAAALAPFETGLGWTVTLREARIATGAFYYFNGPPAVLARRPAAPTRSRLASWLLGTAHAHPGHYSAGLAMGQMLQPATVDLRAGMPAVLPAGTGITGGFQSATFSFAAPPPGNTTTGGDSVRVAGTAEKTGTTIHFSVGVPLAGIEARTTGGHVDGCVFEAADVAGDGTVTVTVDPRKWFDLVDFTGLPPGTPESPIALAPGSVPHLAFIVGLVQLRAYRFSFTPALAPIATSP